MRNYATAQLIGTRTNQCDATAVSTDRSSGARAYVLLDGIGDTPDVREWTREAARLVARTAARRGDAETGLRAVYDAYAAERNAFALEPEAVAVVAVTMPGMPLKVAWSGDSRAYLIAGGTTEKLTDDHNLRRVNGGRRNIVTSCLGSTASDDEVKDSFGHATVDSVTRPARKARLLLASDGGYDPLVDAGRDFAALLAGTPRQAARRFSAAAVRESRAASVRLGWPPYADNATVLVADLTG